MTGVPLLFLLGVGMPTLLTAVYEGGVASDRYVSQADFVVRGVEGRRATGLERMFQSFGLSRAVDDANAVQAYLLSRDALEAVTARLPLRDWFGDPRADVLSRFPRPWASASDERLYDYYRDRVSVVQNGTKGITTLSVQAFAPDEARQIAETLLDLAEDRVNRMNARARADAVRYAEADLDAARGRLLDAQTALTGFRTREAMIDPASNSGAVLDTVTALSTDLARTDAEISEAEARTASSPALPVLQSRAGALAGRIARERARIAGDGGAPRVAAYETLALDRQLAETGLAEADVALARARQEARRQAVYIERIVSPRQPDEATEPRRLRTVATVLVLSFALTAVLWILTAGAREHVVG